MYLRHAIDILKYVYDMKAQLRRDIGNMVYVPDGHCLI